MKILLVGEFSRLHNSLKEGLIALGHEVLLVGSGDQFKKYPVDLNIDSVFFNRTFPLFIRKIIFKLTNKDIAHWEIAYRFKKLLPRLKDFDVVQLINEDALVIDPKTQIRLLKKLIDQNRNLFLLCCGDDYTSVSYAHDKKYRYSYLTPYFNGKVTAESYKYSLKYLSKPYKELHKYIFENSKGVIASDMDYHLPMNGNKHYLGMIPNPINTKKLKYIDLDIPEKVIIFHGINDINYYKKGNDIFEEALEILSKTHSEKFVVITVRSLPYNEYIKSFNKAHIVLDQVYSYDQGYNALEAMAKGKVVFTGAEQEWLDYYGLKEDTVAINALPNAEQIAKKLEWLIENTSKIYEISKNARAFIEKEHNFKIVTQLYLNLWKRN
jgi:glycosyltransferase involved in cell wall biosynthesis